MTNNSKSKYAKKMVYFLISPIATFIIILSTIGSLHAKDKGLKLPESPQSTLIDPGKIKSSIKSLDADTLKDKIKYSAQDSTKLSKNKAVLSLYGNAKFSCINFSMTADEIIYNKITKKVVAKNYKMLNNETKIASNGSYGEFDVKIIKDTEKRKM